MKHYYICDRAHAPHFQVETHWIDIPGGKIAAVCKQKPRKLPKSAEHFGHLLDARPVGAIAQHVAHLGVQPSHAPHEAAALLAEVNPLFDPYE